ncbi:unnamed protein product [Bursaphelenchus xylophilus]|nr:unnamed protein product [Bursaphelenchus xylophilus]CAG9112942.1 unnamed protein product [Bursaphelenchus xylophilus]
MAANAGRKARASKVSEDSISGMVGQLNRIEEWRIKPELGESHRLPVQRAGDGKLAEKVEVKKERRSVWDSLGPPPKRKEQADPASSWAHEIELSQDAAFQMLNAANDLLQRAARKLDRATKKEASLMYEKSRLKQWDFELHNKENRLKAWARDLTKREEKYKAAIAESPESSAVSAE